ncbi:hypothetical protein [Streptosporangium sp. NPDC023615]|uniref:hypothetical protein n=1 Tax=Streptosporangium sp. NPDC023615 TaxID=3154794 RepID=UPI0034444448
MTIHDMTTENLTENPAGKPVEELAENPAGDLTGKPGEKLTGKPVKKPAKNRAKRRVAKGLAWIALIGTAVLVLAEPWVLLSAAVLLVAIALWD